MTVRAWFTISALAVLALLAAVAVRLLSPPGPPAVIVRSGSVHLEGRLRRACWPARSQRLACRSSAARPPATPRVLPRRGSLRVVVAFPVQPKEGSITITRGGRVIQRSAWRERVAYELEPGRYLLEARADYPARAFVDYLFSLQVR